MVGVRVCRVALSMAGAVVGRGPDQRGVPDIGSVSGGVLIPVTTGGGNLFIFYPRINNLV